MLKSVSVWVIFNLTKRLDVPLGRKNNENPFLVNPKCPTSCPYHLYFLPGETHTQTQGPLNNNGVRGTYPQSKIM